MEKILKLTKLAGGTLYKNWSFDKDIHIPASNILYYESLYDISKLSEENINCIEDNNIRCMIRDSGETYLGSRIVLKAPLNNDSLNELYVVETPKTITAQLEN